MEETYHEVLQIVRDSPHLSAATRQVFLDRLAVPVKKEPEFFHENSFRLLIAVSNCLIPQENTVVDLAGLLDTSIVAGEGDGWRYADTVPDKHLLQAGVENVDKSSQRKFQCEFVQLTISQQNALLQDIQTGEIELADWQEINSSRFFEELLLRLIEIFYSHPITRLANGEFSSFDQPGWNNPGVDGKDWEH